MSNLILNLLSLALRSASSVIEMNDVNTILTCVDDVALGDAAEEGNF